MGRAANISAHTGAGQVKIDGSESDRKIFPRFAGYRAEVISNEGPVASRPCNFHPTVHFHVADLSLSLSLYVARCACATTIRPRTYSSLRDTYRYGRGESSVPFSFAANSPRSSTSSAQSRFVGCKGWICEVGGNLFLHHRTWKLHILHVLRGERYSRRCGIFKRRVRDSRITRLHFLTIFQSMLYRKTVFRRVHWYICKLITYRTIRNIVNSIH